MHSSNTVSSDMVRGATVRPSTEGRMIMQRGKTNFCRLLQGAFMTLGLITITRVHTTYSQEKSQPLPSFEVASVKRNTDRQLTVSGVTPAGGGRVSAKAATLKDLIQAAYRVKSREIFGGPGWLDSERFDIEAKAASDVGWEP